VDAITDPAMLFAGFRQSRSYDEAYDLFYRGKVVADDVTADERRQAFEDGEAAKNALIAYATRGVAFAYRPAAYPAGSRAAIDDYIAAVRRQRDARAGGASRDAHEALDAERTLRHVALADALVTDGAAPNRLLGRTLGRLILIGLGLDSVEGALEPFADRVGRALR